VFALNPRHALRRIASFGLATAAVTLAAAPAQAAITIPGAAPRDTCAASPLSQSLAAFGDLRYYTLAPGGDFALGSDWQLSGGATVGETRQADGTSGGVLDLPSKAQATSPVMCITSDYPIARLRVRNIRGSEGVFFYVSYLQNGQWTAPKNTGQFHGDHADWTLSNPMNVQPSNTAGWQQVRFTFVAGGNTSRFQVDDFWVDPRAHW
jgi:hypothetical protein